LESSCGGGNEHSGFHKMLENYRVAAQLVASRVVLSSTELVSYYDFNECCILAEISLFYKFAINNVKGKDTATALRSRGGPQDCGTSRLPHDLDNRPRDGDEV
jgi:hypothetical protein